MKKALALILALALVFAFAACGKTAEESKPGTPANETPKTDTPKTEKPAGTSADVEIEASEEVTKEIVKGTFNDFVRYTTPHTEDIKPVDPTGKTLWIGQAQIIEGGNPHKSGASCFYDLVFDKLMEYDMDTAELKGVVFKTWEMSEDNSTLTFTMPENIYFHDGTNATAEDVFYTLERCTDPALSQQADKNVFGNVDFEKSEITGTYSGKIVLKTPTVTFVPGLTKCWLLCKSYIEKVGEDNAWWSNTVGSGPYKVDAIIESDRYELSRVDNYWTDEELPPWEHITIRGYTEQATMYMDYETHNLDMIVGPSSSDVELIANGGVPNTVCDVYSLLNTYCLVFNEEAGNPALYDENVRKAICYAIDAETVEAFSWEYLGSKAESLIPSALPDSVSMAYEQDIEAAKKALADAGYKPGELHLIMGTQNGAAQLRASETMQEMLNEVGFDIEMITVEPAVNIMNMRNAGSDTYDMSITMQSFETLESANLLGAISHACGSVSFTGASDDGVDELALKARASTSVEEKQEIMREMENYLHDHYWVVPLVEAKSVIVYRDYLDGIRVLIPRMADLMNLRLVG